MLVGSRFSMIRDLFLAYPWLTVIEANRKSIGSVWSAYQTLKGSDLTLTQESERPFSAPSKLFARLVTKKGGLYGFNDGWFGNKFIYDHVIPFRGEAVSGGVILEEQKALEAAGVSVAVKEFSLTFADDSAVLPRFDLAEKHYVLLHLFAGSEGREISQTKRIELVSRLRASLPAEVKLLLTGGKGSERQRTDDIASKVHDVRSIAGETSILEFINLIARAKVVVSLNTGASHIAAHLKTPVVVLAQRGGKSAWWSDAMYGGKPIVLCNQAVDDAASRDEIYPPSMEQISNEEVVSAVIHTEPKP
jgi:ADP-heptose:LPS heptosyltransferase